MSKEREAKVIKKLHRQETEVRKNMCGGTGTKSGCS